MEKEHYFIDKYLKALSIKSSEYPMGIGDDCATIEIKDKLITSKDISVSGIHFPKELDPYFIAYRSVAIAISDIFAMGVKPTGYLLGITHPKPNDNWLQGWREESIATQEDGNAKDDKRFLPQRFKIELSDSRLFNETTKSEESNGVEVIPIHNDESLEDTLKQSEGKSNLGTDKARIYELVSVISCVTDPLKKHKNKNQHLICHVKVEDESNNRKWMVFNDIKISGSSIKKGIYSPFFSS